MEESNADNLRNCPFCAELIQREAVLCRHCKSDLKISASTSKVKSEVNDKNAALKVVGLIAFFVALLALIGGNYSSPPADTSTETATISAEQPPVPTQSSTSEAQIVPIDVIVLQVRDEALTRGQLSGIEYHFKESEVTKHYNHQESAPNAQFLVIRGSALNKTTVPISLLQEQFQLMSEKNEVFTVTSKGIAFTTLQPVVINEFEAIFEIPSSVFGPDLMLAIPMIQEGESTVAIKKIPVLGGRGD